jgi:hypothetical protein
MYMVIPSEPASAGERAIVLCAIRRRNGVSYAAVFASIPMYIS